jgi:CRISPR-associated endonuclease/helicase Cas3
VGYREYFRTLTGHEPYAFQEAIGRTLLRGESVVFRAPTGAGKTWTTIAPYLYSLGNGSGRIGDRLIYALPLRALAASLHKTVVEATAKMGEVLTSAKDRVYQTPELYCSLQMGGENNDPFFEGDLIFCTIDQLLSTYLMMPLSLPKRLANIAAGALIGSLVVLDEVHLLESGVALGTVIEMMHRLRGLTQFVFMTATMSDSSILWLAKKLGASAPELPTKEIRSLPIQSDKKRVWRWNPQNLSADAVVEAQKNGGRTLVIVNQVQWAQDLYLVVAEAFKRSTTKVSCLHSMFLPEDRASIEITLQPWFGKEATQTDVILIATQVVEAGIDICADRILTDLAPMNALVQRAGRTARYVERNAGRFEVFEVESANPYDDCDGEITATRKCLQELSDSGEAIDFEREQQWIERVHGTVEARDLATYDNLYLRRSLVDDAILKGDRGRLSELVRDIDSVNILLSGAPDAVEFDRERWPALFAVSRKNVWKLKQSVEDGMRCVWKAVEIADESGPVRFSWSEVKSARELAGCWFISVGPPAASYSKDVGLRLGVGGDPLPVLYTLKAPALRYSYYFETWVDHVRRVMDQSARMDKANALGADKLDGRFGFVPGAVRKLTQWSVALHDVGKLATDWQDQAWTFETMRTGRKRGEPLAHTTKGRDEQGPKLPPHAVEGAFAVAETLSGEFSQGVWPIACAIARHHSARAKECRSFKLELGANELLKEVGVSVQNLRSCKDGLARKGFSGEVEVSWDDENRDAWLLYAYLARRLRLADQAGTREGVAARGSDHDQNG